MKTDHSSQKTLMFIEFARFSSNMVEADTIKVKKTLPKAMKSKQKNKL